MTTTPERTEREAVATLRQGLLRLVAGLTGIVTGVAALAFVIDMSDHQDDWDGLGAIIAAIVGVPCAMIGVVAIWAVRSGSRLAAGITAGLVVTAGLVIGVQSSWGVGPLLLGATLLVTVFVAPSRTR